MIEGESRDMLLRLVEHMERTEDAEWCVDVVRTGDGGRNCAMGHVFNMGGHDVRLCNMWWNWFEAAVSSSFVIYQVNDGRHPDYQQETPKGRVLAYLRDVLDGKVMTTAECMKWEAGG